MLNCAKIVTSGINNKILSKNTLSHWKKPFFVLFLRCFFPEEMFWITDVELSSKGLFIVLKTDFGICNKATQKQIWLLTRVLVLPAPVVFDDRKVSYRFPLSDTTSPSGPDCVVVRFRLMFKFSRHISLPLTCVAHVSNNCHAKFRVKWSIITIYYKIISRFHSTKFKVEMLLKYKTFI